jgi:nucleotide-binding universal stress UspA family protein
MRVLLAVDGSRHSQLATAAVAEHPWPDGTIVQVLTVIHVAAPLIIDPACIMAAAHVDLVAEQRRLSSAVIESAVEAIRKKAPGVTVTTKVVEGNPKDAILEEAREWDADLIVVGSHGYGRLKRAVLGSVAGAVVADAPCSVCVARDKQHDLEHAAA